MKCDDNQLVEGQPGFFGDIYGDEGLVSDLSLALGMNRGVFYGNRGYQGWYDVYKQSDPFHETSFQKWTRDMWWRLGEGDNIEEAITYATSQQTEFEDPCAPVNTFRLKGRGFYSDIILGGD
jgi:hypothetical protein